MAADDNKDTAASQTSSLAATPPARVESPQTAPSLQTITKSSKYRQNDLVTLVVGPEEEQLIAYKHRLVKSSEFFRAALQKQWKEGRTHIIKLPEENVAHTTLYLDYLFGAELPSHSIQTTREIDDHDRPFATLCKLYMFGERVLDLGLRNAVVREIIRLIALKDDRGGFAVPDWPDAVMAYQGTTAGSPLRHLFTDLLVIYGDPRWLDERDPDVYPPELVLDVLKGFNKRAHERQNPAEFRDKALNAEDYLS